LIVIQVRGMKNHFYCSTDNWPTFILTQSDTADKTLMVYLELFFNGISSHSCNTISICKILDYLETLEKDFFDFTECVYTLESQLQSCLKIGFTFVNDKMIVSYNKTVILFLVQILELEFHTIFFLTENPMTQ